MSSRPIAVSKPMTSRPNVLFVAPILSDRSMARRLKVAAIA